MNRLGGNAFRIENPNESILIREIRWVFGDAWNREIDWMRLAGCLASNLLKLHRVGSFPGDVRNRGTSLRLIRPRYGGRWHHAVVVDPIRRSSAVRLACHTDVVQSWPCRIWVPDAGGADVVASFGIARVSLPKPWVWLCHSGTLLAGGLLLFFVGRESGLGTGESGGITGPCSATLGKTAVAASIPITTILLCQIGGIPWNIRANFEATFCLLQRRCGGITAILLRICDCRADLL
ncbi:hypothetical protein [Tuwongella immobilis]|uniref:hypothetical protein n=1 Tax=Tuwongella immobilis TaxID=692036 RepID=UPI0013A6E6DA|nr:hypothetical protein [Tuwongella immobilis]